MKRVLIVFLCLCSFSILNAQSFGYLGKKTIFYLNPSITLPNNIGYGAIRPGILYGASVEYIYKKRSSIGFKYNYMRNLVANERNYSNAPVFTKNMLLEVHTFGPYVKFQFKRLRAPLGTYFKVGTDIQVLKIKDLIILDDWYNIIKTSGSEIDFTFNLAIGRNWIIANTMLLGFEFESNLPFRSAFDYSIPYNKLVSHNLTSQLFKLKLNLGFLLF